MNVADAVGATGMVLLLAAFLANVAGRLRASGAVYQTLHAVGAALLTWYSIQLGIWIFAVLEGVSSQAAVANLVRGNRSRTPRGLMPH